ncbi:MAG: MBL fold metallo-hydrolase [Tissierellia bacterium]|nr:MBL fold metallo-hydrolase [Tissierellia bacterium]
MDIQFLGAAQMVTGSLYLVTHGNKRFLVDCGLFQGSPSIEKLNKDPFAFDPSSLDFVILTHAHIDHSGRLPLLYKNGFKGNVYATKPTTELCRVMLVDSAFIQENDIEWENKKRQRIGQPMLEPLYTTEDAEGVLNLFVPHLYDQWITISDEIRFRFRDAGHMLGSSIIEIYYTENNSEHKIVFSGDLGMPNRPILQDPTVIESADYLVLESTYGNRTHDPLDHDVQQLIEIIRKTTQRGGSVIIPAFAVERTQELIYMLNKHYAHLDDYSQKIPIYIDSPMAVEATKVFQRNSLAFDEEAKKYILDGENPFQFENLFYVKTVEESKVLNSSPFPKVIISASGMANAGRIRHHLKHNLWNNKNSVVFVGYQAEGTLGRMLVEGVKQVKLLGEVVDVNAEIYDLHGFSAHADQPGILNWIKGFEKLPQKVFIVHGEPDPANELAQVIEDRFSIKTHVPSMGEIINIKGKEVFVDNMKVVNPDAQRIELESELAEVYEQFSSLVRKSHLIYDEKFLNTHYYDALNNLITLQNSLMDLNMLIGK